MKIVKIIKSPARQEGEADSDWIDGVVQIGPTNTDASCRPCCGWGLAFGANLGVANSPHQFIGLGEGFLAQGSHTQGSGSAKGAGLKSSKGVGFS